MAKVKGPCFSLEAKNQLGKGLIYSTRKGQNIVRAFNVPKKVKTHSQGLQRARYKNYREEWRYMEAVRKVVFNQRAKEQNRISGYHQFLHENLDPSRKGQLYLDLSCQGLWHFNEKSGATAYDGTRNHNNGNIIGATRTPGKFNGALKLNGDSDYINCSNNISLNITDAATIEAWIKPEELSMIQTILSKGSYSLKINADDKPFFEIISEDVDTWTNTGNLASATYVFSLAVFNGKLYAGTYPNGDVFVYNETANTWANTGDLLSATQVYSLAVFNGKLYAGTTPNGNVFVYNETANTWANTGDLLSATRVFSLAVFNGKLYAGTYPNGDVFVYNETANTWANTGDLLSATQVYSLAVFNGKLYAGTYPNGDVFVYNETANTWANTGDLLSATYVFSLAVFNGKLYAGTQPNGDVFVYNETANTWANTGDLASATRVFSLAVFNGKLYAGIYPNGDVFVYNETANTWANTGDLLSATQVYSLAVFNGKLYAGTYPNGDVFVAGNGAAVYSDVALTKTYVYIAATYDKNKLKIYINNVLIAERSFNESILTNTLNLLIGNSYGSSQSSYGSSSEECFEGEIDEVSIYNYVKSAAERKASYDLA